MLQHIIKNNLHDQKFVTKWVLGFDELKNTYCGKQMNGGRRIQLHPSSASKAGIADGREGTIFEPNSFGYEQRLAEEFGLPTYEPANALIDDRYYDNLSGQQAYKCFACRVKKA